MTCLAALLILQRGAASTSPGVDGSDLQIPLVSPERSAGRVVLPATDPRSVSPLFFQVVIYKALVDRGLSTLDVLVIGLLAISIFETILGILADLSLRAHDQPHRRSSARRAPVPPFAGFADAMAYFQARRVGDFVARVRELENIRNFLTSSALTLGRQIHLFFTFAILAVTSGALATTDLDRASAPFRSGSQSRWG